MKDAISFGLLLLIPFLISATETKVMVRAKAKDAKFIGSSMGGAYVIIRNELNNEILAEGLTQGSTGNTKRIMKDPRERDSQLSDDNTAGFLAIIDIDAPTFITIAVFSPHGHKQSQIKASTQLWLIPGKHILGDGVVLEISGFIIDVLEPRTHQYVQLESLDHGKLTIEANIVMMCGCTISDGGIWDSARMEVRAIVKKDGENVLEIPMRLVNSNLFSTAIVIKHPGDYEITVCAYNKETGNTGVQQRSFIVL